MADVCQFRSFLNALITALCLVATATGCSDGNDSLPELRQPPSLIGTFGVGHSSFTAIDAARENRMIPVDVWYPVDSQGEQQEPTTQYPLAAGINLASAVAVENAPVSENEDMPLVVFSHGYGGINTASVVLMETLASHGFVVISPEHIGNSQSGSDDAFDIAASNRVPDVSSVIDTLTARGNDASDAFYRRVNTNNVGVVGHSFRKQRDSL